MNLLELQLQFQWETPSFKTSSHPKIPKRAWPRSFLHPKMNSSIQTCRTQDQKPPFRQHPESISTTSKSLVSSGFLRFPQVSSGFLRFPQVSSGFLRFPPTSYKRGRFKYQASGMDTKSGRLTFDLLHAMTNVAQKELEFCGL